MSCSTTIEDSTVVISSGFSRFFLFGSMWTLYSLSSIWFLASLLSVLIFTNIFTIFTTQHVLTKNHIYVHFTTTFFTPVEFLSTEEITENFVECKMTLCRCYFFHYILFCDFFCWIDQILRNVHKFLPKKTTTDTLMIMMQTVWNSSPFWFQQWLMFKISTKCFSCHPDLGRTSTYLSKLMFARTCWIWNCANYND